MVARSPDPSSSLPFLIRIPIDGGLWYAARESWPRAARVYCHPLPGPAPRGLEILEEVPTRHCSWRGAAIDLILDRASNNRAQFVFTKSRGRQIVLWQTPKAASSARPGVRVPGRKLPVASMLVHVDSRERYPYRFAGKGLSKDKIALRVGDYAVSDGDEIVATVERKTFEDFVKGLSDGTLGFALGHLATMPAAAVVVEGTYSRLLRHAYTPAGWLVDLLARLQARYRSVPIVFAESRKLAEEWTCRFLAAALAEARDSRLPLDAALPRRRPKRARGAHKVPPLMTGTELLERLRLQRRS